LLAAAATEGAIAAVTERLFGAPTEPRDLMIRGPTIRDIYVSVIDSDRFRAACGRICASYAW
jgi:hypothetical protein